MRLFWHELKAEQRIFWRNRESAVFIFIFPPMLFLLLGSVYDGTIEIDGREFAAANVLLGGLIGYGAANTGFAGTSIVLVVRREYAILKRLRSTPLPAPIYVGAMWVSTLAVFALQTVVMFTMGRLLFDTPVPDRIGSLAFLVVLGGAAFAGLGYAAASVIRSAEGASAVVNVLLLPAAFVSGAFGARDYPAVIEALADVLPLRYFIDLVLGVYLEHESVWSNPGALGVVAAWGIGGALVGARYFKWEPQAR
jgi:ABC-2 type transport system permease protein